ncbi:MAG: hypothetical protein HY319_27945 [Armatimonadetes bacterium]|nr:hypothetical protein [Armatimonadota bacterium]
MAAVKSGEWGQKEFLDWLQWTAEDLDKKGRNIFECFDPIYRDGCEDEVDTCTDGVTLYERGMEILWQYTQDGDVRHLEEGLAVLEDGNKLVNHAMYLNREAYEEMDVTFFM